MKDLNFDELDEAVTSLMKGVDEKDTSIADKTLDVGTTLAPDEAPAYSKLSTAAEKIGGEAIDHQETTVSLNAGPMPQLPQRGGRFMDVMHPSSDMKTSTTPVATVAPAFAATPVAPVSRQGMTIAAPDVIPDEQVPVIDTTAGNLPESSGPLAVPDEPEAAPEVTTPEPQTSPFLPDAKVEKRPLGQATDEATSVKPQHVAVEPPKPEDINESEDPDDELDQDARDRDTPVSSLDEITVHVPEEFQDELLAVEMNTTQTQSVEIPTDTLDDADTSSSMATASIPKQYQEKPSTGDDSNGSIYDTTSYHQPLSHPETKKSGWIWVVVIVLIIALCAGAAAAAYYSGIL